MDPAKLAELGKQHGIPTTQDNESAARASQVVVIAVKPQVVDRVLGAVGNALTQDTLVISIAAGVPIALLEGKLPTGTRVVRAMPNTPAIALASATAIAGGVNASAHDLAIAKELFEAVGTCVVVEERLLDVVTGLSGAVPPT